MQYNLRKIKQARERRGWDQTTCAYKAKVSLATICRMETGDRTPSPKTMLKILRALGLTMDEVIVLSRNDEKELVENRAS